MHTSQHVSTRIGAFTATDNLSSIKSLLLLDSKWTSGIFCPPRGKLPWQRRRTAKRERSDCASGGKTDIFFCFFPFCSSSVTMGSSIVPVANATTWYSEKKKKKKRRKSGGFMEQELCRMHWMLSLRGWSIHFWLCRFPLSDCETRPNLATKSPAEKRTILRGKISSEHATMFPIWDFVSQKIKLKYFFKKSLFCKISLVFDEMYLRCLHICRHSPRVLTI